MSRSTGLRKINLALLGLSALSLLLTGGCGKRETLVDIGDHTQEYRVGNSDEPSDLDPQTAIGELEDYIMVSLFEGLVVGDPKDVSPRRASRNDGTSPPTAKPTRSTFATTLAGPTAIPSRRGTFWNPTGAC